MKKYFSIFMLALLSLVVFSCKDEDYDTYSKAFDISATFTMMNGDPQLYGHYRQLPVNLIEGDVMLVYRMVENSSSGPVWQQIPRTLYLSGGDELDYDFDFTSTDVQLYANGNYNLASRPAYLSGQVFRIVMVPASAISGRSSAGVNLSDYNAVVKYYNIDESKIKSY